MQEAALSPCIAYDKVSVDNTGKKEAKEPVVASQKKIRHLAQ